MKIALNVRSSGCVVLPPAVWGPVGWPANLRM